MGFEPLDLPAKHQTRGRPTCQFCALTTDQADDLDGSLVQQLKCSGLLGDPLFATYSLTTRVMIAGVGSDTHVT